MSTSTNVCGESLAHRGVVHSVEERAAFARQGWNASGARRLTMGSDVESNLTRRAALAGMGVGGFGLAMAARSMGASARQATPTAIADHPLTGMWLAMANPPLDSDPQVPVPSLFGADGTVVLVFPPIAVGQNGIEYSSSYMGTWEPYDEQRGHFNVVRTVSDPSGNFVSSTTIDGYPLVNEDGTSFIDDGSLVTVTIRDASGAILQQIPGSGRRPVTGIRMSPRNPGFPESSATPTS
jgi:hypothetical protein